MRRVVQGWGEGGSGEVLEVAQHRRHADPGAALGEVAGRPAVAEGRSGDVEVGPRDRLALGGLGELLEEEARGERAAPAVGLVRDVGDEGVEARAQVRGERQRPRRLVDLFKSRACRGAIMFNDSLTQEQCERLVERWVETSW